MATTTINGLGTLVTSLTSNDLLTAWRAANGDMVKITKANLIGATFTGGGVLATGGYTLTVGGNSGINGTLTAPGRELTVPATGTAALLGTAQTYTTTRTVNPASTSVNGVVSNMPASNSGYAFLAQYNGTDYIRLTARSNFCAITMPALDLGNNQAGPFLTINRNNNATNPTPGSISLVDKDGVQRFLWVDTTGDLRISTTQPTNTDTIGTVVGTQS